MGLTERVRATKLLTPFATRVRNRGFLGCGGCDRDWEERVSRSGLPCWGCSWFGWCQRGSSQSVQPRATRPLVEGGAQRLPHAHLGGLLGKGGAGEATWRRRNRKHRAWRSLELVCGLCVVCVWKVIGQRARFWDGGRSAYAFPSLPFPLSGGRARARGLEAVASPCLFENGPPVYQKRARRLPPRQAQGFARMIACSFVVDFGARVSAVSINRGFPFAKIGAVLPPSSNTSLNRRSKPGSDLTPQATTQWAAALSFNAKTNENDRSGRSIQSEPRTHRFGPSHLTRRKQRSYETIHQKGIHNERETTHQTIWRSFGRVSDDGTPRQRSFDFSSWTWIETVLASSTELNSHDPRSGQLPALICERLAAKSPPIHWARGRTHGNLTNREWASLESLQPPKKCD